MFIIISLVVSIYCNQPVVVPSPCPIANQVSFVVVNIIEPPKL
jgi:hypothetical protein